MKPHSTHDNRILVFKALWTRCIPPAVTAMTVFFLIYIKFDLKSYKTTQQKISRHVFETDMFRWHSSREEVLTKGRHALEYWWTLKENERNDSVIRCPLRLNKTLDLRDNSDYAPDYKRAIVIMEAMGLTHITTCYGRYPTIAYVNPFPIESDSGMVNTKINYVNSEQNRKSKRKSILKLIKNSESEINAEDQIEENFCYKPAFYPQQLQKLGRETALPEHRDPTFCPRLLKLYRSIQAGESPPLLTLFTWLPDVLEDPNIASRKQTLLSMNLLRPFINPVLISDKRMVMSLANSLSWPCLPVKHTNPDGVPLFESSVQSLMDTFNSTFYGYLRRASALDASLLETLLAVKERYIEREVGTNFETKSQTSDVDAAASAIHSSQVKEDPTLTKNNTFNFNKRYDVDSRDANNKIILYGSSIYSKHLRFGRKLVKLADLASNKGTSVSKGDKCEFMYIIHSKMDFADLPPFKLDDQFLIPSLVSRAHTMDQVVIDTSSTILSLHTSNENHLSSWGRMFPNFSPIKDTYTEQIDATDDKHEVFDKVTCSSRYNTSGKVIVQCS